MKRRERLAPHATVGGRPDRRKIPRLADPLRHRRRCPGSRDAGDDYHREGRRVYYRLASLPDWAQLVLCGLAEGGVPSRELTTSRLKLTRFDGRPVRLGRTAS